MANILLPPLTNTSYPSSRPLQYETNRTQRRPPRIAELAARALTDFWDPSQDLKHVLRMAERYRKEAQASEKLGDLENAFIGYARAATLAIEKIPAHRDYEILLNADQRHNLGMNGSDILSRLSKIKPTLESRYVTWLRDHSNEKPVTEGRGRTANDQGRSRRKDSTSSTRAVFNFDAELDAIFSVRKPAHRLRRSRSPPNIVLEPPSRSPSPPNISVEPPSRPSSPPRKSIEPGTRLTNSHVDSSAIPPIPWSRRPPSPSFDAAIPPAPVALHGSHRPASPPRIFTEPTNRFKNPISPPLPAQEPTTSEVPWRAPSPPILPPRPRRPLNFDESHMPSTTSLPISGSVSRRPPTPPITPVLPANSQLPRTNKALPFTLIPPPVPFQLKSNYATTNTTGYDSSDSPSPPIDQHEWPSDISVVDLTGQITTLQEEFDFGGFAVIHIGEWKNEHGRHKVAIKLIRVIRRDDDGARLKKRIAREIHAWHRLDHPNIVQLLGMSYHINGKPSMIMPWYERGNAVTYLRTNQSPIETRMSLVRDVARGLVYLHTSEPPIVHGDLKGNNILVADDGHAALTDFGLSQIIQEAMGPSGYTTTTVAGSVRWQAPEVLRGDVDDGHGERLTTQSDVWSFACTAYELLIGKVPYYPRVQPTAVILDIIQQMKPQWKEKDVALCKASKHLRELLNECWSFEPSGRPSMVDAQCELDALRY